MGSPTQCSRIGKEGLKWQGDSRTGIMECKPWNHQSTECEHVDRSGERLSARSLLRELLHQ